MYEGNAAVLERVISFTAARHRLIAENIANIDTPGYRQKDLSVERFQEALRQQIENRNRGRYRGTCEPNGRPEYPLCGILAHDGNNRSMEQLATDMAKNAMMHNVAIELLRKQYQQMDMALRERVV